MKSNKFEKGDKVKVWSLQSWKYGGFLNGGEAYVRQNQGSGDSVVLIVPRNFDGEVKIDEAYEVYARQCELIEENHTPSIKEKLLEVVKSVLNNTRIK